MAIGFCLKIKNLLNHSIIFILLDLYFENWSNGTQLGWLIRDLLYVCFQRIYEFEVFCFFFDSLWFCIFLFWSTRIKNIKIKISFKISLFQFDCPHQLQNSLFLFARFEFEVTFFFIIIILSVSIISCWWVIFVIIFKWILDTINSHNSKTY